MIATPSCTYDAGMPLSTMPEPEHSAQLPVMRVRTCAADVKNSHSPGRGSSHAAGRSAPASLVVGEQEASVSAVPPSSNGPPPEEGAQVPSTQTLPAKQSPLLA